MQKNTVEKGTQLVLGVLGLVVLLIYVINAFNLGDWSSYIYTITGVALSIVLFIEGGIMTYFKTGKYKSIDWKDIVVWVTMGVALVVLVNTIIGTQLINEYLPATVIEFFGQISGFVGIIAGIMILIQMITPRIE